MDCLFVYLHYVHTEYLLYIVCVYAFVCALFNGGASKPIIGFLSCLCREILAHATDIRGKSKTEDTAQCSQFVGNIDAIVCNLLIS